MSEDEDDEDDGISIPSEKHYADFQPSSPPSAPDGGIAPGFAVSPPSAPLEVNDANFVCVRGPCRHYWHLVTMSGAGNPEGTWAAIGIPEPKQHHHTCLVQPGRETDLTDDNVFACSKWDPLTPDERNLVQLRRRTYYDDHPEFAPDVEAVELTEQPDDDDEEVDDASEAAQG